MAEDILVACAAEGQTDLRLKHCNICDRTLPTTNFHKRAMSNDGLAARCKDCQRVYDFGRVHKPKRVAQRAAYYDANKGNHNGKGEWALRNPDKRSAHVMVGNAIRDGRLKKEPCEKCGDWKVQAHHDDYSKPLDVRWLCRTCHTEWHMNERRSCILVVPNEV